jgi:hypothetical protein
MSRYDSLGLVPYVPPALLSLPFGRPRQLARRPYYDDHDLINCPWDLESCPSPRWASHPYPSCSGCPLCSSMQAIVCQQLSRSIPGQQLRNTPLSSTYFASPTSPPSSLPFSTTNPTITPTSPNSTTPFTANTCSATTTATCLAKWTSSRKNCSARGVRTRIADGTLGTLRIN